MIPPSFRKLLERRSKENRKRRDSKQSHVNVGLSFFSMIRSQCSTDVFSHESHANGAKQDHFDLRTIPWRCSFGCLACVVVSLKFSFSLAPPSLPLTHTLSISLSSSPTSISHSCPFHCVPRKWMERSRQFHLGQYNLTKPPLDPSSDPPTSAKQQQLFTYSSTEQ